jgi:hypothetical protein
MYDFNVKALSKERLDSDGKVPFYDIFVRKGFCHNIGSIIGCRARGGLALLELPYTTTQCHEEDQ